MAPRFSDSFIDKVMDSTDIVQLISKQTRLSKKGSRYFGLCPFHNEKTPSFSVSADKGLYYCYGCEKGGNAIGFVMDFFKFSFPEAIEYLASNANIPLEYEQADAARQGRYAQRKRIYQINREAANFYYVQGKKNARAVHYIKKRGLSSETMRIFGIGYAPKGNNMFKYLKSKEYDQKDMLESSLVRERNGAFYDYFQDRIMFPILDVSDNIVGFGGRIIDEGQPKYLNSPETAAFVKNSTLYNLNNAKNELKNSPLILVEGYMDVIGLYEKGIKTACASLGTALSSSHANLIKRYSENVVLCYDGDEAGINAAMRGADILTQAGLMPRVLLLGEREDPDSFVLKYGADAFLKKVGQSVFAIDFKLDVLSNRYNLGDIVEKAKFVKEACYEISKLNDEIKWDHYAKRIAFIADTDISAVKSQIAGAKSDKKSYEAQEEDASPIIEENVETLSQRKILKFIMQDKDSFDFFEQSGGNKWMMEDGEARELYGEIERLYAAQNLVDITKSLVYNNKIAHIVSRINADDGIITKKEVISCIKRLNIAQYEKEMKKIKHRIQQADNAFGSEDISLLLKEYSFLKKKLLEQKNGGIE